MLRFLHTADLQIGMTAPGAGSLAKQLQEARVESLKTILQLAAERKVNFLIVVGDLFETNQVSKKYIQQVARLLEQAALLPVYILPGNHDYYGPSSVYVHEEFLNLGKHIQVFSEKKPIIIAELDLTFYPSPCFETRSSQSPIPGMKKQAGTKYHIAVVHGSIPSRFGGTETEEDYFPITEEDLKNLGMDYIALGHWHSLHPDPQVEPNSVFFYSGTPEPTGFGERKSGYALLVELDEDKRVVSAIPTAQYRFVDFQSEIKNPTDLDVVRGEVHKLPNPEKTLIRLVLNGVVSMQTQERVEQLVAELQETLAYLRCDQHNLLIEPTDSDLQQFTKDGIAHTAFRLLKSKRDAAPANGRATYDRAISLAFKAFKGYLE